MKEFCQKGFTVLKSPNSIGFDLSLIKDATNSLGRELVFDILQCYFPKILDSTLKNYQPDPDTYHFLHQVKEDYDQGISVYLSNIKLERSLTEILSDLEEFRAIVGDSNAEIIPDFSSINTLRKEQFRFMVQANYLEKKGYFPEALHHLNLSLQATHLLQNFANQLGIEKVIETYYSYDSILTDYRHKLTKKVEKFT